MRDLSADTAVSGENGRYTAELSSAWSAWGPNGGYVTAPLVRTEPAHGSLPRVASVSCHFAAVGKFAPVEVEPTSPRRSKQAESVQCTIGSCPSCARRTGGRDTGEAERLRVVPVSAHTAKAGDIARQLVLLDVLAWGPAWSAPAERRVHRTEPGPERAGPPLSA
ncbi:acyl-CoA thioesterase domain-containing protein [Spirillospora sp. CA-253888]